MKIELSKMHLHILNELLEKEKAELLIQYQDKKSKHAGLFSLREDAMTEAKLNRKLLYIRELLGILGGVNELQ